MKDENTETLIKAINHMVKEIKSFAKHNELKFETRNYLYQVASVGEDAVKMVEVLNKENLGCVLETYE